MDSQIKSEYTEEGSFLAVTDLDMVKVMQEQLSSIEYLADIKKEDDNVNIKLESVSNEEIDIKDEAIDNKTLEQTFFECAIPNKRFPLKVKEEDFYKIKSEGPDVECDTTYNDSVKLELLHEELNLKTEILSYHEEQRQTIKYELIQNKLSLHSLTKGQLKSRKYCSVPQCSSYRTDQVSLHRFPFNPVFLKKWTVVLRIGKPITKCMCVCALHFKADDYHPRIPFKTRRVLKLNVVPSCNIPAA